MEHKIHITFRFNRATGKVDLNEFDYEEELSKRPFVLEILEQIFIGYNAF